MTILERVSDRPRTIFVLHPSDFLTDHEPHGDGLTAFGFIDELARRGYRLHLAAREFSLRAPLPPNVTLHKVPVRLRLPLLDRLEYMLRARLLFRRLRRRQPIHLVHQMNPVFAGLSLAFAGCPVPVVLGTIVPRWPSDPDSLRARHPKAGKALQTIKNWVVGQQQKRARLLLLTSPAAMNRLPHPEAVRHKVMFVPHGIDTQLFSPAENGQDPRHPPTILFLANLQARKGIFTLLQAFPAVAQAVPECRLQIAGSGPEASAVAAFVEAMPCRAQIQLVGKVSRDHVSNYLRQCTVYCLPSFGEPFGATVVEAMGCAVPVVVTAAGGFPYLVPKGGGRLVPPGDAGALAAALIEVLLSKELQRSMGAINREHAAARLSWKTAVDKVEIAYQAAFSTPEVATATTRGAIATQPLVRRLHL